MTVKERILERLRERKMICETVASLIHSPEKTNECIARSSSYARAIKIVTEEFAREGEE